MDSYFDQIARTVAGSMTRRQALWRIGGILGGAALSALGLAGRASGGPTIAACNAYCGQFPVPALSNFLACRQTCLNCTSISQLCGTTGSNQACCSAANGTAACVSNTCTITGCNAGFADCNHAYSDGCETSLSSDATQLWHLRFRPVRKGSQVATVGCAAGSYIITSCNAGFADCGNGLRQWLRDLYGERHEQLWFVRPQVYGRTTVCQRQLPDIIFLHRRGPGRVRN